MTGKAVADEKLAQIAAQQWELFRRVREGALDAGLVIDELQRIIEGGLRQPEDLVGLLADWQALYKDVFEIRVDFSGLSIPEHRKGFDRLIIVAKEMTFERLFY